MSPIGRRALALCALALPLAAGCREGARAEAAPAEASGVEVVDDAGRTVRLPRPARRIVALMPSGTQTLIAIGGRDRLAGRTDFDADPALRALPSVGGGLDPSLETLVSLRPDLVLGWELKDKPQLRDRLESLGIPVFALRMDDTTDVFRAIANLGRLTGLVRGADSLAASLRAELAAVRASVAGRPRPSVFYVSWYDPPMTAGPETFIGQAIDVAGGRNAFADVGQDWPTVSMEELVRRQPDFVVLPQGESGQGRLEELRKAPGWRELRALREPGRAVVLPGELVNVPGPNLAEAARRLRDALHPDLAEAP